MTRPLALSALSVLLALLSVIFIFTGFFTQSWIRVLDDENQLLSDTANGILNQNAKGDFNQRERLSTTPAGMYGLFDHGFSDLNCDAIPFPICMYTRAGIFSSILLSIPSLVLTVLSSAIMSSGGSLATCGFLSRTGATCFLISTFGGTMGMLIFTLQQTSCLVNCPSEDLNYYPRMEDNRVEFAYSFFLSWAGQILSFFQVILLFVISWTASKTVKEQYFKDRQAAYHANRVDVVCIACNKYRNDIAMFAILRYGFS